MSAVRPVSTERVGGSGRAPERLLAAAAVLLTIAALKPWPVSTGTPVPGVRYPTSDGNADRSVVAHASPSPTVDPGPDDIACEGGWRLVSITHQAAWTIKEWMPVDPAQGSGPVDGTIPFVALDGTVRAVGVCGDGQELGHPDHRVAIRQVWRVTEGSGATVLTSVPLVDVAATPRPAAFARLYRPSGPSVPATWSPGRYVLELGRPSPGPTWWLGIIVPGGTATS